MLYYVVLNAILLKFLKILFLEKVLKELKEAEKRQKQLEKKDKKVFHLYIYIKYFRVLIKNKYIITSIFILYIDHR